MATAYASTKETNNYFRLCRIYVDLLRDVLWQLVQTKIPASDLQTKIKDDLKHHKGRVQSFHHQLLTVSLLRREPVNTDFDISVLYIIIRNLCKFPPPAAGWNQSPKIADVEVSDDVEQIRMGRNLLLAHCTQASVSDSDYETEVQNIQQIVLRMDLYLHTNFSQGLNTILSDFLDPNTDQVYQQYTADLTVQRQHDQELEQKVEENKAGLEDVQDGHHSVPLDEDKVYHVFFSYSTEDVDFVKTLVCELETNHGLKCTFSARDFVAGRFVLAQIEEHLTKSMVVVMILSPDFLKSHFCRFEVDVACRLDLDRQYRSIIPVVYRKCEVPVKLRHINYIDVGHGEDVAKRIVKAIRLRNIGRDSEVKLEARQRREKDMESKPRQETVAALPLEIRRMDSDSINLYKKVLEEGQEAVYNIRIMVIGHFGVGKTTLVHRLLNEDVDMNRRESTNGIEVHVRRCKVSLENQEWRVIPKDDTEEWISQRLALSLRKHRPTSSNREEKEEVERFDKDETSHSEVTGAGIGLKQQAPIESPQPSSNIREKTNISKQSDAKVAGAEQKDDKCIAEELKVLVAELEEKGGLHEFPNHADVSFWDFAGQYVFYTTHQIFLSSKAVYVLVTDMSKHIEDIVVEEEDCNFDTTGKRRISDFVDFWLNSVHSFSAHSTDSVPPVILVGTHADKLRKSDVSGSKKYFEALRFHLADKETRNHLIGSDIDIDNTVTDPNLDTLRRTIFEVASKQSYWGEALPVRWLSLEREEGLREYVVLDSQWMVDALKSLITAKDFFLRTNLTQHWTDLSKRGILRTEVLDAVWTKQQHPSFHDNKDHLLTLMEKLNIISKPESSMSPEENPKMEQYYLMPCMLRNQPPQELLEPSTEFPSTPVLVFFSPKTCVPSAVFHRLLSACLSKWPIRRKGDQHLMFCGCGVFSINQANTIHVVFREYTIQTWVTKIAKKERDIDIGVCREVKEYLEESLKRISGYLTPAAKYSVGIQCPESNFCKVEHLFTEQNLLAEKEISCSCNGQDHTFDTDLSRFWFQQVERESTPNGNWTLEVGALKISCRKLSRGDQTPVFEGEYERIPVAIKKIPKEIKESNKNAEKYKEQLREMENLRTTLQHNAQNIVRFLHSAEDKACFYFAFELCQGTLEDYVERQRWDDKLSRPNVLQQITNGLAVLHHQLKIAHRDLKPLNILIRSNGSATWVLISDFGCSKMFGDDETCSISGNVGSNGWVAPEIYRSREESPPGESIDFTKECDMFSLGCLFFYVASNGKHPFGTASSNQQTNINVGRPPNFKELPDVLAYMQPLIAKMVSSAPQDRPAASDIQRHPAIMRDNIIMDFFCLASRHIPNREGLGEVKSVFPDLKKGWLQVLPHTTRTYLETYGIHGTSGSSFYKKGESKVQPLLRAVRNFEEHFDDLILQVKSELGCSVSERVAFWLKSDRFPNLPQYVYDQLKTNKKFMKDWLDKIHV